jgi:hypothetical protein
MIRGDERGIGADHDVRADCDASSGIHPAAFAETEVVSPADGLVSTKHHAVGDINVPAGLLKNPPLQQLHPGPTNRAGQTEILRSEGASLWRYTVRMQLSP